MEPDERRVGLGVGAVWRVGINVLAMVGALWFLYAARTALALIGVALLISLAMDPLVGWLTRHRFRRGLAVLTVFLAFVVVITVLLVSFLPRFIDQVAAFAHAAPDWLNEMRNDPVLGWLDERLHFFERATTYVREHAAALAQSALSMLGNLVSATIDAITLVALIVFMLLFGREVFGDLVELLPPGSRPRWIEVAGRVRHKVGGYVAGAILIASIGGLVVGTTLALLGVEYFLPLGAAMVGLGLIPFFGPAIAAILIIGATAITSGWVSAGIMAGVFAGYQLLENHVLQPLIQRRTIRMNPLFITVALILGLSVAGILGAAIALPVAGAAQVVIRDVLDRRKGE